MQIFSEIRSFKIRKYVVEGIKIDPRVSIHDTGLMSVEHKRFISKDQYVDSCSPLFRLCSRHLQIRIAFAILERNVIVNV